MSVPSPPRDVVCVPGNLSLIFTWTVPSSDGGAPISQYTISVQPGNIMIDIIGDDNNPPATAGIVPNLKGGVAYTFDVTATNIYGRSIRSGSIIPATIPSPVRTVKALYTSESDTIIITWVAPLSNGGVPITGYTLSETDGTMSQTTDGNTFSYTYTTGFTHDGIYTFKVVAINDIGSSIESISNQVIFLEPPANISTSIVATGISLSWTPPPQPVGNYNIFRYIPPNSSIVVSTSILGTASNYIIRKIVGQNSILQNGITYVTGIQSRNNTIYSEIAWNMSTLFYELPDAPTSIIASTIGQTNTASLEWIDAITNREISGYTIKSIPVSPGLPYNTSLVSSLIVSSLTYGTKYKFSVSAINNIGSSPFLTTTTEIIPTSVPSPPSTSRIALTASSLTISWTSPVSTGGLPITGYTVTSTPPDFTFSTLGTLRSSTIRNIIARESYTFDIIATNDLGNSAAITTDTVRTNDTPDAPDSITAIVRNQGITLFWSTPTSSSPITGYQFSSSARPSIYYDMELNTATLGPLNQPTDTITIQAINSLGAGLPASYGPVEISNEAIITGKLPGYIPNPTTRPGIFAKLGQFVTFMNEKFVEYKFSLPIGEWRNNTELGQYISSTRFVAQERYITGGMSRVFPEVDNDISLILYQYEDFSGNSLTYTNTSPYMFDRDEGDHTPVSVFAPWGLKPNSVVVRQNGFMGINISKVIPGNNTLTLPITITEASTISVNWGDGVIDTFNPEDPVTHTYTTYGDFTIRVSGDATAYGVGNGAALAGAGLITNVTSWGSLGITSYSGAFSGCSALISIPLQLPSTITNTSYMFNGAYKFNNSLSTWIMTDVTDVTQMFQNCIILNTPAKLPIIASGVTGYDNLGTITSMNITVNISSLNNSVVSLPFTMDSSGSGILIDWGDSLFDIWTSSGPRPSHNYTALGNYTIGIFGTAVSYGVGLAGSGNVEAIGSSLITGVTAWGDLGLTSLSGAFYLNNNLTTVPSSIPSTVTNLSAMFYGATSFNSANVTTWDISNVTNTSQMFSCANRFNQDISNWDTSAVTSMDSMFSDAYSFLQDLSAWDVSNVTVATDMFNNSQVVSQPIFTDITDQGTDTLAFISTFTDVTASTTIALPFTIALTEPPNYITITWGDNVYTSIKPQVFNSGEPSYTYTSAGNYTVAVSGVIL